MRQFQDEFGLGVSKPGIIPEQDPVHYVGQ
jgi:hypothetical protein